MTDGQWNTQKYLRCPTFPQADQRLPMLAPPEAGLATELDFLLLGQRHQHFGERHHLAVTCRRSSANDVRTRVHAPHGAGFPLLCSGLRAVCQSLTDARRP
jgi:hypothetical protein